MVVVMTTMKNKSILEIKTDEKYELMKKEVKLSEIIVDLRFDKYIVICSLDFCFYTRVLPILFDFIKNRFDNEGSLPDKIYILKLTEAYLDMGENFFTHVVDKGFWFTRYHAKDIPKKEIQPELIFINGDLAVTSNVKKYSHETSVNTGGIKTYGFPFSLLVRTRKRLIELNANNKIADYNSIPTKHFICLNANSSFHRVKLITKLHETNIIDKCYWSWLRRHGSEEWDNHLEKCDGNNTAIFDFRKTKELDMSLEDLEIHINQDAVSDFYYLTDSLIDIGIETTPEHYQFISEKTWKPYLHGKVSFFFNCQSYYAILKNLGFELYDEIFDYSFDTIKDTDERETAYYNELKRISEIPIDELQKKILSIKDKILRNRNHAWNCDVLTLPILKEYPILAI
jgi:hypothetical protein